MKKTLLIRFRTTGKIYQISSFDPKEDFKIGEKVLVDTEQGIEIATILGVGKKNESADYEILQARIRKFKEEDEELLKELAPKAAEAFAFCEEQIKYFRLPMRLIKAEISLDEKKLTFYFTAEERVDFRDLLSILINHFHKNIRLQQIGPRDAARLLGGFGSCGRPLCCQTFLANLESVSVELAKEQELTAVGISKITGLCGKLMCCLQYEGEVYQKLRENLPAVGERVRTEKGVGEVIAQNILKQTVWVKLKDGSKIEHQVKPISKCHSCRKCDKVVKS